MRMTNAVREMVKEGLLPIPFRSRIIRNFVSRNTAFEGKGFLGSRKKKKVNSLYKKSKKGKRLKTKIGEKKMTVKEVKKEEVRNKQVTKDKVKTKKLSWKVSR